MFNKRFSELIQDNDIKQSDIANYLNIKQSSISKYKSGTQTPSFTILLKIAEYFNVSTDYLLGLVDSPNVTSDPTSFEFEIEDIRKKIMEYSMADKSNNNGIEISEDVTEESAPLIKFPVFGKINDFDNIFSLDNFESYASVDNTQLDVESEYYFYRVNNDNMINARIVKGDLVFARRQYDVDDGDIAVVLIENEEVTLMRVLKNDEVTILQPENPKSKPILLGDRSKYFILGKVMYVQFEV